jgi:hypothetical protein
MARKSNDPIKAAARRSKVERRLGEAKSCTQCGESRSEAIVARSRPRLCEQCYRVRRGAKKTDAHHIAGKANSPITIEVPANDHRGALSAAQYEWPPKTLQNPDGSPILRMAGAVRGVTDFIAELVTRFLESCARGLELLDNVVRQKLGDAWWVDTPIEGWWPT